MLSIWNHCYVTVDYTNLRKLDLNLLLALDALIQEASVTKAAEKLNVSQSSMSYSLKRLRELLEDPILMRTSREMEATPYALQVGPAIREALLGIQGALLSRDAFDPERSEASFRIAASDYTESTLGSELLKSISIQAPHVRIRINDIDRDRVLDELDRGSIDLCIGVGLSLKGWHVRQELYREEFACVVDNRSGVDNHSGVDNRSGIDSLNTKDRMSLEVYADRPHILVSMRNDFQGAVDRLLEQQQLSRKVVWSTSHFMAVPFLIPQTDNVTLLPKRMAQKCAQSMGLQLLPPPVDLEGFTVSMYWHQRNTNLPSHQWLRNQLVAAASGLEQN